MSSFQPIIVGSRLKKGLIIIDDTTLFWLTMIAGCTQYSFVVGMMTRYSRTFVYFPKFSYFQY